jgi:hypothetical protein
LRPLHLMSEGLDRQLVETPRLTKAADPETDPRPSCFFR